MNLLFDLHSTQPFKEKGRHGGGIYGEIILKRIIERKLPVCVFYSSTKWINPEMLKLLKDENIKLLDLEVMKLSEMVKLNGITKLYSPLPHSISKFKGCKIYGTIHGLRDLETPLDNFLFLYKNCSLKGKIKYLLRKIYPKVAYKRNINYYNRIFKGDNLSFYVVSNHTAYSIKAFFPYMNSRNIKVFYSPSTFQMIKERKYQEKYFLLVSADRWEKNCLRSIMALDNLFSEGMLEGYRVKVTGAVDSTIYSYRIKNLDRFDFYGYVSDDELAQLYHDAYSLIYMSLNEGFGYPPLESMHNGVPVIASPFTSITEICSNAVLYSNPFSIKEIMSRIIMMTDSAIYEKYSSLSKKRATEVMQKQKYDLDELINDLYEL